MVNAEPEQIVTVLAAIVAFGLTVTVTWNVAPVHVPVYGVTVYVAVATLLVVFVSVPVMVEPLPDEPPLNPDPDGADQL